VEKKLGILVVSVTKEIIYYTSSIVYYKRYIMLFDFGDFME
jgi:hypothetical protein